MLNTTISLNDAAELILTCGTTNTFVFEGEPGIGKSAMLQMVAQRSGLDARYVDCALLDLGDIQMPRVSDDKFNFVPNGLFVPDGKPLVVMLDEIGKANRTVQNGMLTLLLEHRIGEHKLPNGSIVFATTNMASDGVGDMMQAHAKNRVSFMQIRKPNADEWIEWATNNDVDPVVMAWVKEYPHALESYKTLDAADVDSNPYIFNPRKVQGSFVSNRSLAHASSIVKKRNNMSPEVLIAALSGTIGESAARDMQAYLDVADSLQPWSVIIAKPDTAEVPESPIANVIAALGAVMRVDSKSIGPWVTYMNRLPKEVQFLFVSHAMRTNKAGVLAQCRSFTDWAVDNSYLI